MNIKYITELVKFIPVEFIIHLIRSFIFLLVVCLMTNCLQDWTEFEKFALSKIDRSALSELSFNTILYIIPIVVCIICEKLAKGKKSSSSFKKIINELLTDIFKVLYYISTVLGVLCIVIGFNLGNCELMKQGWFIWIGYFIGGCLLHFLANQECFKSNKVQELKH